MANRVLRELSALLSGTEEGTRIFLGFVIGLCGLDHPDSHWLLTAFKMVVTGMVAQGYALHCSIKRMQKLNS